MIIDLQALLSNAQALTATAVSTNVYDAGSEREIGVGEPLSIVVVTVVAADVANADETYQVDVQVDSAVGFASPRIVGSRAWTTAQATAELTLGAKIVFALPQDFPGNERFVRLNYTLGGTTPSWTVSSFIVPTSFVEAWTSYPDAITIAS
jgi:hypothetical protein